MSEKYLSEKDTNHFKKEIYKAYLPWFKSEDSAEKRERMEAYYKIIQSIDQASIYRES